jgi:ketosteroid isomerase-like protein
MSTNTDLVRRFYDAFGRGRTEIFDEILADDWELKPPLFGTPGTRDGEKQTVGFLHGVLSDISYTVEDIYDCDDGVVAARNLLRARQTGPFLGLAPTGGPIELMTMEFHHVREGRIVLTWHIEDFFGVYQALLAAGAKPQA